MPGPGQPATASSHPHHGQPGQGVGQQLLLLPRMRRKIKLSVIGFRWIHVLIGCYCNHFAKMIQDNDQALIAS